MVFKLSRGRMFMFMRFYIFSSVCVKTAVCTQVKNPDTEKATLKSDIRA